MHTTVAFVGVAGGTGATRLSVECAATLARAGHDVAVLDAAFGTQGLASYVDGRIDPDLTAALTGDGSVADAFVDAWPEPDGRAALAAAYAPFERVARAKGPEPARQFESCLDRAADRFDHVIVDVPPVADNQAVAAVSAVDARALIAPDSRRGADHLARMRGRLVDVGTEADALVANRVDGDRADRLPEADHEIPVGEPDVLTPASLDPDDEFAVAVGDLTGDLFGREVDVELPESGLFD